MMASETVFDVAVVGAGIGGACAAIALARGGARILVLEAAGFPRHKVCGEFLSPESKAVFARLGVLDAILQAGATPIHNARIVARNGQNLNFGLPGKALSLSRFRLDEILFQAAGAASARVLCDTRVRAVTGRANDFRIASTSGEFRARAVLNAAGRNASWLKEKSTRRADSPVRSRYIGLKAHFRGGNLPQGLVELHAWRGGYCGLSRVEDGLLNVCLLARYDSLQQRAPQAFWNGLLEHLPALRARMKTAQFQTSWLATGNVSFGASTPIAGDIWCCGDAAGFIHPLAGDGMAMAARSGELAAAILNAHLRGDSNQTLAREIYESAWRREFASRLRWAARFQHLLIDSQLLSPALSLFARVPPLHRFAVRATRG